jgi:hypothetical protein
MEIRDVEKVLAGLSPDETKILIAPSDLEELIAKGFPFKVTPPLTLDEFFDQKKKMAADLFKLLPPVPNGLPPDIKNLYHEILECMAMGLFGPAITMCAILVEFALKRALWLFEVGGHQQTSPQSWNKYEEMDLGKAINGVRSKGIISKEQKKALDDFRVRIRNPYLHYNIQGITSNVVAEGVKRFDLNTGTIDTLDIPAAESIPIQTQAKPFMDIQFLYPVFVMTDSLVKYLDAKIKEAFPEPQTGANHPA